MMVIEEKLKEGIINKQNGHTLNENAEFSAPREVKIPRDKTNEEIIKAFCN